VAKEATAAGDLPWWEVFEDETLQGLIRTALAQNKDLRIAAARVQEARGLYRAAKGDQFPEVSLDAGLTRNWTSKSSGGAASGGAVGIGSFTSGQVGVDVTYQADLWGQFRRATEAARADLLAQEQFRKNVLITLIGDVARAYFELRELDEELQITKRTVASRQSSLSLTRQREKGGIVSLLDVRQSEAELAVAAGQIAELERRVALKENEISILLGQNPGAVEREEPFDGRDLPPDLPVDLPSALLERRPDILAAEKQLVASNARIGEAKAKFFPQVNLSNFVGMTFLGGPVGGGAAAADTLAGNLFQLLFDGGRRKGNLEAAKARFEQALARYEQAIQQGFREVSDSLASIRQLEKVRKQQEAYVAASRDGLRLAGNRYQGGVSSYLEVLDAQRQAFNSQLALAQTRRDQRVAVVQLYRALGGGWAEGQQGPLAKNE
jgi:multidrug efflux system outer membrane protein